MCYDENSISFFSNENDDQNILDIIQDLRTDFNFDISGLFQNNLNIKTKFDVTITLKYKSIDEINKRFKVMKLNEKIKEKLYLDEDKITKEIDTTWTELMNTKKRRRNKITEKIYLKKDIDKKSEIRSQLGRKRKGDNTNRKRNKFSAYNIIKKIKNKIVHYILIFVNKLIKSLYTKQQINEILFELDLPQIYSYQKSIQVIRKIKHGKIANETKRDDNLNFLGSTIGKYLSNIISTKYKCARSNANKLIIERLLQDENKKEIFEFIFNTLKIEQWLNIFTYKEDIDIYAKNSLNNEQILTITKNFVRIENLFYELTKKVKINDDYENYLNCFTILIFNFKEFIENKESRNRQKKTNNEESLCEMIFES